MFERRFLYPEEIVLFFKLMKEEKNSQLLNFKTLYETGSRYNECKHVRVKDIYLQIPLINFTVTKGRGKAGKGEKKVGKPRQVKISKVLAEEIRKYIKKNNLSGDDYLFSVANSTINRTMERIFIKMGHPHPKMFSAHNWRKTHISHRMAIGEALEMIVIDVGNDEDTSKKHYVSPDLLTEEQKLLILSLLHKKVKFQ